MKNLLKILLVLSITIFSGCKNVQSQDYKNVFYPDPGKGVVLSVDQDEFCKLTSFFCGGNGLIDFIYVVDNGGQIYLFKENFLYIVKGNGDLKDIIDLNEYAEKLLGIHEGNAVFIDSNNDYVYIEMRGNQNTNTNYVYAKYSIKNESISEFKDEKYLHSSYIVENSIRHTSKNTLLIPRGDGSVESLDTTRLEEDSLIIGADEEYLYYLSNLTYLNDDFPQLMKANKTFSVLDSIEVPVQYKTSYSGDKEEATILWGDVFLSSAGDIYISFIDQEKGIWYIKKYEFQGAPEWESYSNNSFSFDYPTSITLSEEEGQVVLKHSVPYEHYNTCDLLGPAIPLQEFTDFDVWIQVLDNNMRDAVEAIVYSSEEYFEGDSLKIEPGFIDPIEIGDFDGFEINLSAEYCGGFYYFFTISKDKTLVIYRKIITELIENPTTYLAIPNTLSNEQAEEFFTTIISSLKVN